MSEREKLLGIAVACLLAMFSIYGIYSMGNRAFDQKRADLASLKSQLRTAKRQNERGKRDQQLLYEYHKRSLSAEPDKAHREFVHWLENEVKKVGLQKESVKFQGIPSTKKPYKELSYNISGVGDVRKVTKLLYSIHSADNLQRIRNVTIRKQSDNLLKLDMMADALSMAEIDGAQLQTQLGVTFTKERLKEMTTKNPVGQQSETKLPFSLEEYESRITSRNLFSPANLRPKFISSRRQEAEIGKGFSVNLKARDPDGDAVVFELGSDAPESAELTKSGRLSWRPKELGEYEFKIYLTDAGIPSKESVETMRINVVPETIVQRRREDPFDEARLAVLTAIVQGPKNPRPQMCMYLRSEDEVQYLEEGDDIIIGKWSGVVTSVEPDQNIVKIQTDGGEYILQLGQALADATIIEPET